MALPAIVDTLDKLPEPLREHYRPGSKDEGAEGRFVLDVDGGESGFSLENVAALKSALRDERKSREAAEQARKRVERLEAEGIRLEELKSKLQRLEELEKLDPAKEADRLAQARIEAAIAKAKEAHEAEIAEIQSQATRYRDALRRATISATVDKALAQADALNPEAVRLKIERMLRIKETDDSGGPFVVEVVDDSGEPQFDSRGQPMTVEGVISNLRADPAWATSFKPLSKSGAGAVASPGGARTISRRAFEQMTPQDRAAVVKSGVVITDA